MRVAASFLIPAAGACGRETKKGTKKKEEKNAGQESLDINPFFYHLHNVSCLPLIIYIIIYKLYNC